MLQSLSISNYALISSLSVEFDNGFSVITGETGAGKSILLCALGFVLGNRADSNILFDDTKKCVVEAYDSFLKKMILILKKSVSSVVNSILRKSHVLS